MLKQIHVVLKLGPMGSPRGLREDPRGAFGALAASQGALGKVDQVHGVVTFEGNPRQVLTISFFDVVEIGSIPRGS